MITELYRLKELSRPLPDGSRYRIWLRVNHGIWEQRHDWHRPDGSVDREEWIKSLQGQDRASLEPRYESVSVEEPTQ